MSLFCTFVPCGSSNTKTTWNKTFGEGTRNSWANQLLLPPEGSFNRANLECKNTNSYCQRAGSEDGERKEGGKAACLFLSSEWEGGEKPNSFSMDIFRNAILALSLTTRVHRPYRYLLFDLWHLSEGWGAFGFSIFANWKHRLATVPKCLSCLQNNTGSLVCTGRQSGFDEKSRKKSPSTVLHLRP